MFKGGGAKRQSEEVFCLFLKDVISVDTEEACCTIFCFFAF